MQSKVAFRGSFPHIDPVDPKRLGIVDPHVDIDTSVASPARMYDYYLGGKDNFPADHDAAEKVIAAHPEQRRLVKANRGFLVRAVRYLAGQGITQFLDLGTGIPTSPNVHEVAREAHPDARVVYVDNDPILTAHNRALRATHDGVAPVQADIRDPRALLAHPDVRATLDFDRPIAVLTVAEFHFIPEAPEIVDVLRSVMAPRSYLALSTATTEGLTRADVKAIEDAYAASTVPAVFRSREEIEALFAGTEPVAPGLVPVGQWGADDPPTHIRILAGVARVSK